MGYGVPFILVLGGLAVIGVGLSSCQRRGDSKVQQKFALILQADSDRHEGLARALHALLYAKELKESGAEVVLIFDGAGSTWAEKLQDPQHKLHPLFADLEKDGVIQIVCDFCSGAFKVKDKIKDPQFILTSEYQGHPSVAKWVKQGYQLIIL